MRRLSIVLAVFVILQSVCFAQSIWAPFNGIYTNGSCTEPEYTFIVAEGLYLYIFNNGARLTQPVELRQSEKFLLQKWPAREGKVWISYNWVDSQGYHTSGRAFVESEVPALSALPALPPADWQKGDRQRCQQISAEDLFVHAEGISFMNMYQNISSVCQEGDSFSCLNSVFKSIDVSEDERLSKAEISRMIRILTYMGTLADPKGGKPNDKIFGSVGIAALVGPFIASSIIDGSDYNGDGQLSMDELFLDRDVAGAQLAMRNMSLDVAVSSLGGLFKGLTSVIGLFR